jgi:hypothetical protein
MVLPDEYCKKDEGKKPPDNHSEDEVKEVRPEQNIEVEGEASQVADESAHDVVSPAGRVFRSFYWVSGANCQTKSLYTQRSTSFRHSLTSRLGFSPVESLYTQCSTSFTC